MKRCYAIYRLPEQGNRCFIVENDEATALASPTDADSSKGFVLAPFQRSKESPIIYIKGEAKPFVFDHLQEIAPIVQERSNDRQAYHQQFQAFHEAISKGRFQKLVLSRTEQVVLQQPADAQLFFRRACHSFPHCFIALFHTPETGTWLTATPEILLEQTDNQAHTIALAGTMPAPANIDTGEPWSNKNIQEQLFVADYIRQQLSSHATDLQQTAARTFVAGNVMHLRTDFFFTPDHNSSFGLIAGALHPTPAVCGLPTAEARTFILAHEQHGRKYYSGYCGPVGQHSASHLFVMLRCMNINAAHCTLYAGGGIVMDSTEEEEWQETEAKLFAMRHCLGIFD